MKMLLAAICLSFLANAVRSQNEDPCAIQSFTCTFITDSCERCINENPCCSWCYDIGFSKSRCDSRYKLTTEGGCQNSTFVFSDKEVVEEKDFTVLTVDVEDEPAVQVKPQRIKLNLKLNDPVSFQIKYKAAENYPLDLYFLMDISYTMQEHLEALAELGEELPIFLKNLTTTFRLALGVYSDKVAMPYQNMEQKYLENPCLGSDYGDCQKGFDFKHIRNFTNLVQDFINDIKESKVTSNADDLEGGFDALMQILSCNDRMKWRTNSRKMVIIATDAPMHTAGDGILAGVPKKNPGNCFLDARGEYTKSLEYDYPSLEEISRQLEEKKMNLLFAIKKMEGFEYITDYYKKINDRLPDVTGYGELEKNSKNVLKLIQEEYTKVFKNLKFVPKFSNRHSSVELVFKSHCNKDEFKNNWNTTFSCDNVEPGLEYIFNVTATLRKLPRSDDKGEIITIEELNLREDVTIEVEYNSVKCDCGDETWRHGEANCNNGTYVCGKCNCDDGWAGFQCDTPCNNDVVCRFINETFTSSTCYGHGLCSDEHCGCICLPQWSGQYCQYPQCIRDKDGYICGGRSKGECIEGSCVCSKAFSGPDCSCPTTDDTCSANGEICNGVGDCVCGKCECREVDGVQYEGPYCEWCPECTGFCETYSECVIGTIHGKDDFCVHNYSTVYVAKEVLKEDVQKFEEEKSNSKKLCYKRFFKGDKQCNVQFMYKHSHAFVDLKYVYECWETVAASMVAGVLIAAILVLGSIIIAVCKFRIVMQEKREFAAFEEKRQFEQHAMNPLYTSPVKTYQVPDEYRFQE